MLFCNLQFFLLQRYLIYLVLNRNTISLSLILLQSRCATGEAWPSIMLSCAPPKPCDPRTNMNRTTLMTRDYYAQALSSSSFNRLVIDTNGSSTVDLHDHVGPKVMASSGKLAEKQEENVGKIIAFSF